MFDRNNATEINRGSYVNSSEKVSGCARVFVKDNNRYLIFENFKATAGPFKGLFFYINLKQCNRWLGDFKKALVALFIIVFQQMLMCILIITY